MVSAAHPVTSACNCWPLIAVVTVHAPMACLLRIGRGPSRRPIEVASFRASVGCPNPHAVVPVGFADPGAVSRQL